VNREGDILDVAVSQSLVEKSGSWFSYNNERLGQGRENARQFLKDNPQVCDRIEERLRANFGLALAGLNAALEGDGRKPTGSSDERHPLLSRTQTA
jgi:recombination protein RecA